MGNFMILGILVIILGWAVIYIARTKKRGVKCIGCPFGCSCSCKQGKEKDF